MSTLSFTSSITSSVDANLQHDLTTGCAAIDIIHLLNMTPIKWFCKWQNTIKTATYGSEFVAAKSAMEQIMDMCYTLAIDRPAWMFGDNQSDATSSTIPHSTLMKYHNVLAYHHVCGVIAAKVLHFIQMPGTPNAAGVLTKFLPLVEPFLFWKGETVVSNACVEGDPNPNHDH
jgi:hypothetical protein